MKLGKKIGEGGTSELFEIVDSNRVVKLAKGNIVRSDLDREFRNTLLAWDMGVSVPRPYEIVEIDDRPGIVFERIEGETIKDRLFHAFSQQAKLNQPAIHWEDIRKTARLLFGIHQLSHETLQSQRDLFKWKIRSVKHLTQDEKEQIVAMLESLPEKNRFCHGDPNPNNMILRDGDLVMIDWNDATSGSPEADLAEYIIMIKYAVLPSDTPPHIISIFNTIRKDIIEIFMDEYTSLSGITYDDVDPWIAPIATRKLTADAISEEEKQLLVDEIRHRLESKHP